MSFVITSGTGTVPISVAIFRRTCWSGLWSVLVGDLQVSCGFLWDFKDDSLWGCSVSGTLVLKFSGRGRSWSMEMLSLPAEPPAKEARSVLFAVLSFSSWSDLTVLGRSCVSYGW